MSYPNFPSLDYHATTTGGKRYSPTRFVEYNRMGNRLERQAQPSASTRFSDDQNSHLFHRMPTGTSAERKALDQGNDDTYYQTGGNERHEDLAVPVYDVDTSIYDDNTERHVKITRSPIKQLARARVFDDAPKRNFGDYDPVRPSGFSGRGSGHNLSEKAQNRRIIFKGISEDAAVQRRKRQLSSLEEDENKELGKYNKRTLVETRSSYRGDSYIQDFDEDDEQEEQSNSNYCSYPQYKLGSARSKIEEFDARFEKDDVNQTYRNFDGLRSNNHHSSTSFKNPLGDTLGLQVNMFGRNRYEFQEDTPGGAKGVSYDDYDYDEEPDFVNWKRATDDRKLVGTTRTVDACTNLSTNAGASGLSGRSSFASPAVQATASYESGESSWMQYSRGTGFYQKDAWANKETRDEEKPSGSTRATGYYSNNANLYPRSELALELGENEKTFDSTVQEVGYKYRLKAMPIEKKHGETYFGYELEFWPYADPMRKDVAFGYQMTDDLRARESTFAAGVSKLNIVKRNFNSNASSSLFKFRQLAQENGVYGEPKPITKELFRGTTASTTTQVHEKSRNDYQICSGRGDFQNSRELESKSKQPANLPNQSLMKRDTADYRKDLIGDAEIYPRKLAVQDESRTSIMKNTGLNKKEDNFKVAISREPSLISEQFQNRPQEYQSKKRRFGLGYGSSYS